MPAALRLEALQIEVEPVEVQERDVACGQPGLVRFSVVVPPEMPTDFIA
ncbi:MAG TPA: hypothetical protein PKJ78_22445 [Candidatus Hydrogenedentes bacterium]|nr:hypothetical protein [Candidatus Hydrogenedentota bacterium]